jgi:CBS domain-containing protein
MILNKYLVNYNDTIEDVISKILINSRRTVLVIKKKKIVGTITEGDILRSLLVKKNLKALADKIMNKSFKYLYLKKDLKKSKDLFLKFNLNILPVLNKKFQLLDIIVLEDILQ